MRTFNFSSQDGCEFRATVPDSLVFSNGYNEIVLQCTRYEVNPPEKAHIFIIDYDYISMDLSFYNGKIVTNISSMLKQLFEGVFPTRRSESIELRITVCEKTFDIEFNVIFGQMSFGERFRTFGIYDESHAKTHQERHITRFVHFPLTLSYFATVGDTTQLMISGDEEYDGAETVVGTGIFDEQFARFVDNYHASVSDFDLFKISNGSATSKFTEEYNYVFWQLGKEETLVFLHHDDRREGIFLRWVDNKGYWQQYLFYNGKAKEKYERGNDVGNTIKPISDYGVEVYRPSSIATTRSMVVCATSLPKETFDYVCSVANSMHVEMYFGIKNNVAQWIPVKVTSDSIEYETKKVVNDVEIEIQIEESTITR